MTELAIYDMDRTITRVATYTPFLLHAARRRAPWRLLFTPLVLLSMLAYVLKLIDRARLKEINHALLLGRHNHPHELRTVIDSFAEATVANNIHPGALTQIAADRAAGRRLVLATASYRLYSEAIADRLGFDDCIATNSIIGLDGRIRAKIDGENNYGPAKLRMVQAWMAAEGLDRAECRIRFYSDHASDAPVMEWSDEPFAVNAHDKLRRMAAVRGWPTVEWG
ncbi:HAD-superfamily subfamily IB hydrolase, TIGR01490 [Sphingomonas laterariae]|uniref:HAD-superfamily subfamily IB hydrolase, TIGR01490 n=1 Tax=Edaphosphingomonas laterariae TaxID=861865 RepID=A0A239FJ32_9SPHN|nr:HAD-IB family hydrolase [Sphingomonas laterariae]SNS56538.1 HAD-superfamily subfamily IB hydrolase, TIGR01490 [Sphingomonas laterariae]